MEKMEKVRQDVLENSDKLSDEELLNSFGWSIECESPLEVSHTDGSFASGQAVKYLIDGLRNN